MRLIALLRGINVGGRHRVPMTELRETCEALGWDGVRTYIQSGNVLFDAEGTAADAERALERAIERRFRLSIPVVVRSADAWSAYVAGNPYPDASRAEPALVMLGLAKSAPRPDATEALAARAADGERIVRVGDALWLHFPNGAGRSKLSPALLDRLAGSPVTMRNWRTVLALDAMARGADSRIRRPT